MCLAHVLDPGIDFTVYLLTGLPLLPGAVQVTFACALPAVARTSPGAKGTPGLTLAGAEVVPKPSLLRAFTVTV